LNRKVKQNDVTVKDGETYTWVPGTYGKVSFGYQSVIYLSAGIYNVDHLVIKPEVTFAFTDISSDCTAGTEVIIAAARGVDVGEDFKMTGVWFGDQTTACTGGYQILLASEGDISLRSSQSPFYGAILAEQKVTVGENNIVHGCIAGRTGVDVKGDAEILTFGSNGGCTCSPTTTSTQTTTTTQQ